MREENFCYKKPRYSEVRVITRRVIARYDIIISTIAGGLKVKSPEPATDPPESAQCKCPSLSESKSAAHLKLEDSVADSAKFLADSGKLFGLR